MVALFIKKRFSVTETKRNAILFCTEVDIAGYSQVEEPIILCKKALSSTCEAYAKYSYLLTLF